MYTAMKYIEPTYWTAYIKVYIGVSNLAHWNSLYIRHVEEDWSWPRGIQTRLQEA